MANSRGEQAFYDRYHQKNLPYAKIIGGNNFTYYYWLQILHEYVPSLENVSVLDVGCGVGALSLYCAQQGAKVTGLDISERAIDIAKAAAGANEFKHTPTFLCQKLKGRLTEDKFDLIICSEVLEHVPDAAAFMAQIFTNLKPAGMLILSTPSRKNWLRKTGRLKKFDAEVGHVRLFSQNALKRLLQFYPGEIIGSRLTEGPMRMVLFSSKLGPLIRLIRGPLVPLFHAVDHILAQFLGWHDQFIIVKKHA